MWIYHVDDCTATTIHTEGIFDYRYNEDSDTHLISFKLGNIALNREEILQLKNILDDVVTWTE